MDTTIMIANNLDEGQLNYLLDMVDRGQRCLDMLAEGKFEQSVNEYRDVYEAAFAGYNSVITAEVSEEGFKEAVTGALDKVWQFILDMIDRLLKWIGVRKSETSTKEVEENIEEAKKKTPDVKKELKEELSVDDQKKLETVAPGAKTVEDVVEKVAALPDAEIEKVVRGPSKGTKTHRLLRLVQVRKKITKDKGAELKTVIPTDSAGVFDVMMKCPTWKDTLTALNERISFSNRALEYATQAEKFARSGKNWPVLDISKYTFIKRDGLKVVTDMHKAIKEQTLKSAGWDMDSYKELMHQLDKNDASVTDNTRKMRSIVANLRGLVKHMDNDNRKSVNHTINIIRGAINSAFQLAQPVYDVEDMITALIAAQAKL